MGKIQSTHDWQPPPQPQANISSGPPVDYHIVASKVTLKLSSDCACYPKIHVAMDSDDFYTIIGEQFAKGWRMVYFSRRPGDLRRHWGGNITAFFSGFFRMNPNLGEQMEGPVSWTLRVERSWVQSMLEGRGAFSRLQRRDVHIDRLVNSIAQNTQHGERLVAATCTGHTEPQSSYGEFMSGFCPHVAIDLFFEVPSPAPVERYMYNIVLIPVHVEYIYRGIPFFPEIQCDWMSVLQHHLSQGWRLVDIYIDIPLVEQIRKPRKRRVPFCRPTDTQALWIFERPASIANNPRPLYEGTIVEQVVQAHHVSLGVESSPDWLPVIRDMGMRGWELSCVVESHKVEPDRAWSSSIDIKSLLFFQRPLMGNN